MDQDRPPPPSGRGSVYVPPGGRAAPLARALSWLWRLGPVLDRPAPDRMGIGCVEDAADLQRLVKARHLAAAVVFADDEGPAKGLVPARRRVAGRARFLDAQVRGRFTLFSDGLPAVRSSLGAHAVEKDGLLLVGAGAADWGELHFFWALRLLADFFVHHLDRPLVGLPPIGCLRLDDVPGTAEKQALGEAKSDATQERAIGKLVRLLEKTGSRLVVAVAARALEDRRFVPADQVWPGALAAIRQGVDRGRLEVACHGLHHLSLARWQRGEIDAGEFADLSPEQAGPMLDEALAWLERTVGPAVTFVAPAWKYSEGTVRAAGERGLKVWFPARPGPLLQGTVLYESLGHGLPGLVGCDFGPLRSLTAVGLPLTVVFHGRSLDGRLGTLLAERQYLTLLRLAMRRDISRMCALPFIRWVGAKELIDRLERHDTITVDGREVRAAGPAEVTLMDRGGSRAVIVASRGTAAAVQPGASAR
jgi:hypothetical protein